MPVVMIHLLDGYRQGHGLAYVPMRSRTTIGRHARRKRGKHVQRGTWHVSRARKGSRSQNDLGDFHRPRLLVILQQRRFVIHEPRQHRLGIKVEPKTVRGRDRQPFSHEPDEDLAQSRDLFSICSTDCA